MCISLIHCGLLPSGVRFSTLATQVGWYRGSNKTLGFYRCIVPSVFACLVCCFASALPTHSLLARQLCVGGPSLENQCYGYRTGPLCQVCKPGYQETTDRACKPCAGTSSRPPLCRLGRVLIESLAVQRACLLA
jgi:hypothetical protein